MSQQPSDDGRGRGMRRSDFLRGVATVGLAVGVSTVASPSSAQDAPPVANGSISPKPASTATKSVNALYRKVSPSTTHMISWMHDGACLPHFLNPW